MATKTSFNFLNRMRLWQKFLLLGVFVTIAVLLPYLQTLRISQESIDVAQEELSGLEPANAVVKAMQFAQIHGGLYATAVAGVKEDVAASAQSEKEVASAFAALDGFFAEKSRAPLKPPFAAVKQEWLVLLNPAAGGLSDVRKNFDAHLAVVSNMRLLLELVTDEYKLSLDPNSNTYFLIQAATVHLPALTDFSAQLRGIGTARLTEAKRLRDTGGDASAALTTADRERLVAVTLNARGSADNTYRFLEKTGAADAALKGQLDTEINAQKKSAAQVFNLVGKELVDAPALTYDPAQYSKLMTNGIESQFKLYRSISDLTAKTLTEQINDLRSKRSVATVYISLAALAALLVALFTVSNVTGTVKSLQIAVDNVRTGDQTALQDIASRDEVGDLGRTVNSLLNDRLAAQQKAERESETLNASVIGLLQTVFQLGDRDLTVRAPVTEDIIGTVASAINQQSEQTGQTLLEVQTIAKQVQDTAAEMRLQADVVEKTARDERESLNRMSSNLTLTTEQLVQVASLSETSNKTAEDAGTATLAALAAVNGTVAGMDNLRGSISEMEKRFKRLGERSQEISTAVGLINTISERTHVLALNASMQAATAGEAGRGFAVVAEEVQRLSDSSRQATGQISQLVTNIQSETSETLFTVNRLISDVVQQTELAKTAGQQMAQTQTTTGQLVGLVKQIAAFSVQQRQLSQALQQSVLDMNEGSQQASLAISQQTGNSETLTTYSHRLTEAVAQFKVSAIPA
ncbi:MAG: hypothetical protein H7224_02930 [Polaromonas sp.]|nr:hypothetical protein [Polaromonas sp.]